jgi:hypothetical protein
MFHLFSVVYVVIVAPGCFKTRSIVASPSMLFYCLASVTDTGRQRQSPLARVDTTCLRVDTAGEMWAGRRGALDRWQRLGRPNRGLASGCPGASHAGIV